MKRRPVGLKKSVLVSGGWMGERGQHNTPIFIM